MRVAALVALALLTGATPRFHRTNSRSPAGRNDRGLMGASYAFFEAFPASGAGTNGACSTTPPTGARGEVLTAPRASAIRCSTAGTLSGIASAGVVNLTNDIPAVMPGGDGTAPLGLEVDGALTNLILFPSTLNNVNWGVTQNAGVPTVVSTNNPDPLGGTTASRVQFAATVGAQYSLLRQSGLTQPFAGSCYAKMVSGTGELCIFAGAGTGAVRTALNATTWTRLKHENNTVSGGIYVGTDSADCSAGGNFAAQDVYLWNCQGDPGKIVTTPADTTRAAQAASASLTIAGANFGIAATWEAPAFFTASATAFQLYKDASNSITGYSSATGAFSCDVRIAGATVTTTSVATMVASSRNRVACYYDGTNTGACVNGVCTLTAGAVSMFSGASTFHMGTRSAAGNEANSTLKQWCYDPAADRCPRSL